MNELNKIEIGTIATIEITDLVFSGDGIGRIQGKVCFVSFSSPGDKLNVKIIENKKDYCRGEILEVLIPSANRQSPPCPYFGACGGCSWQHLQYDYQALAKQTLVESLFRKNFGDDFRIHPFVKSPRTLNYRNRISLKFDGHQLGYYRKKSHQIVPIEKCLIADEKINLSLGTSLEKIRQLSKNVETYQFALNEDEQVRWENIHPPTPQIIDGKVMPNLEEGSESDTESQGFSQVNSEVNALMIEHVLSLLPAQKPEIFFDLYAGSGNITFPIYDHYKNLETVAVEADPKLTLKGKTIQGKRKIIFQTAFVENYLKRHQILPRSLVVLDPPRGGTDLLVMNALKNSAAEDLIYVSCHPVSLVRDLKRLVGNGSPWKIHSIRCFDMFPQTDHVETVAEIKRRC